MHTYTNELIHETSAYLLQHAHNPVNWIPWSKAALDKANAENKPIIISIGYSTCHWCHVMEHESFEDEEVAELMNAHFICIKVDREERPDIDHVYMDAIHIMGQQGGWPLNCVALPDGRPFFGGTYFPKTQWINVLSQIRNAFEANRDQLEAFAGKIEKGLRSIEPLPVTIPNESITSEEVHTAVARWKKQFDNEYGGANHAPKFPLPNNYQLLQQYGVLFKDNEILQHVDLTLQNMANGGIYDQLGGGFARYSTDMFWKVPHFEKMLYDNGQLISLYSQAFKRTGNLLYKLIVEETIGFLKAEMMDKTASRFYAALDADSEGEEGTFYVWTKSEMELLASENSDVILDYFDVDGKGHWEEGKIILQARQDEASFALKHELTSTQLNDILEQFSAKAKAKRNDRIRPITDTKTIMSWNSMTCVGLLDAYTALGNEEYLSLAKNSLEFLLNKMTEKSGLMYRSFDHSKAKTHGFLEDYAFLLTALIRMHEVTLDWTYIDKAKSLTEYIEAAFDEAASGLYFFQARDEASLFARKVETTDGVIASSNATLATALYKLGRISATNEYMEKAKKMLAAMEGTFTRYPASYSQWMLLHLYISEPSFEVATIGKDALQASLDLQRAFIPNTFYTGSSEPNNEHIITGRFDETKTRFFVCQEGTCHAPVLTVEEAKSAIHA